MLRLHDYVLSERCYAVRLMLAVLGLTYEVRSVDMYPGHEQESAPFRALNPFADLPVLEDGDLVLRDSGAILGHLANGYDRTGTWLPRDPRLFGPVLMWVGFAGDRLAAVSAARQVAMLGGAGDLDRLRVTASAALRLLEDHLTQRGFTGRQWLVGDRPTIADLAVFPQVALSHDAGIGHEDYPAIHLWQRRVRQLRGFITMPGIPDYF